MKKLLIIILTLLLSYANNSHASTVVATETSRAEYENGKLTYSGRFYLATGVVQKSISADEDINNQFKAK